MVAGRNAEMSSVLFVVACGTCCSRFDPIRGQCPSMTVQRQPRSSIVLPPVVGPHSQHAYGLSETGLRGGGVAAAWVVSQETGAQCNAGCPGLPLMSSVAALPNKVRAISAAPVDCCPSRTPHTRMPQQQSSAGDLRCQARVASGHPQVSAGCRGVPGAVLMD